jgi:hypothetical protein
VVERLKGVIIIIAKEEIGTTRKRLAFDNAYRLLRAGTRRQYIRTHTIYMCVCVQNTPSGSFTRERKKKTWEGEEEEEEAASTFNNDVGIKRL